jgi:hypothetical protein
VATLTALESQDLFSGVLLSAPMIMIDPAQATPFKVACIFYLLNSNFPYCC